MRINDGFSSISVNTGQTQSNSEREARNVRYQKHNCIGTWDTVTSE